MTIAIGILLACVSLGMVRCNMTGVWSNGIPETGEVGLATQSERFGMIYAGNGSAKTGHNQAKSLVDIGEGRDNLPPVDNESFYFQESFMSHISVQSIRRNGKILFIGVVSIDGQVRGTTLPYHDRNLAAAMGRFISVRFY